MHINIFLANGQVLCLKGLIESEGTSKMSIKRRSSTFSVARPQNVLKIEPSTVGKPKKRSIFEQVVVAEGFASIVFFNLSTRLYVR